MIKPPIHPREEERLERLRQLEILETQQEEEYDAITRIATEVTGTPMSTITLVDQNRQWFKSEIGFGAKESTREHGFCAHTILEPNRQPLIVQDTRTDERFHDNPFVTNQPNLVFYAGVPVYAGNELPMGTLCVLDQKPRELSKVQLETLQALANQVGRLLELRWSIAQLKKQTQKLEAKNEELSHLSYLLSHDIRSPLNSITSILEILQEEFGGQLEEEGGEMLSLAVESAGNLKAQIKGILEYFKLTKKMRLDKSEIDLNATLEKLIQQCDLPEEANIEYPENLPTIKAPLFMLQQVLQNLIINAVKYSDKEVPKVSIGFSEEAFFYQFEVRDNGPGIPVYLKAKLFKLFETGGKVDRFGKKGTGLGLAIVKKLLGECGGEIHVSTGPDGGSVFSFRLPK